MMSIKILGYVMMHIYSDFVGLGALIPIKLSKCYKIILNTEKKIKLTPSLIITSVKENKPKNSGHVVSLATLNWEIHCSLTE